MDNSTKQKSDLEDLLYNSRPIGSQPIKVACILVGLPARGKTFIGRKLVRFLTWMGHNARIFNVGNYRRLVAGANQPAAFFDPNNPETSKVRREVAKRCLDDMLSWFDSVDCNGVQIIQNQSTVNSPTNTTSSTPLSSYYGSQNDILNNNSSSNIDNSNKAKNSKSKSQHIIDPYATLHKGPLLSLIEDETGATPSESVNPGAHKPLLSHKVLGRLASDTEGSGKGAPRWIAMYDATNSTKERRQFIYDECVNHGIEVIFIESVCDDEDIIMANIKEVKISSPDYVGLDSEEAAKDFRRRIAFYENEYETITPDECDGKIPFVKLVNVGDQAVVNKVKGYIQSRIVYFLLNLNITPKVFYFSRHGESMFNVQNRIGGDADLSSRGKDFATKLPDLLCKHIPEGHKLSVWTSTLKRTKQTSEFLDYDKIQWKQLDELDSGVCEGMTYDEVEEKFPEDAAERDRDKYNYRYHRGESYRDLVQRLEPVIMEMERHHEPNHSILIVGHQAVLRCIFAYFLNYTHEELPFLRIPLHTVVRLTPKAYGCIEERFAVDVPAVDTHRPKKSASVSMHSTNLASTYPDPKLDSLE